MLALDAADWLTNLNPSQAIYLSCVNDVNGLFDCSIGTVPSKVNDI